MHVCTLWFTIVCMYAWIQVCVIVHIYVYRCIVIHVCVYVCTNVRYVFLHATQMWWYHNGTMHAEQNDMNVYIKSEGACHTNPDINVWFICTCSPTPTPTPSQWCHHDTTMPSPWHHHDFLVPPPTSWPPWATWNLFRRRPHGSRGASPDPSWWHCNRWNYQPLKKPTKQSTNQPSNHLTRSTKQTSSQPNN